MGAWAMIVDGRLTYPPPVDGNMVNPCLDPGWRERHSFTWWEDAAIAAQLASEAAVNQPGELQDPETAPDYTAVDTLCQEFMDLCMEVRAITSDNEFRGGFEEVMDLMKGSYGNDPSIIILCNKLSWLNQYITYEANKCKLGQPGWWKRCWGIE